MKKSKVNQIDQSFFIQTDVVKIAKELLGKILCTEINGIFTSGIIVETEAYRGRDDKACHAFNYKKTKRTETMFEQGGIAYVYLCYGIHHLFNIVTSKKGEPDAVLIRAIEPLKGVDEMMKRRKFDHFNHRLTSGPGIMRQALGIQFQKHNNLPLFESNSAIWVEENDLLIKEEDIIKSRRVGVDYAEECALWNWRFRLKNNLFTSKGKGKGE